MESGVHGSGGAEFSAFIGRDRELAELRALAAHARALTLCGAAGIGKTRLAVRLTAQLASGYPDGAWFVELADLRVPELVPSRIASVVGMTEEPGRPMIGTLADALRSRRMLLCLDNCEHLIDACAQACQRLLASSPGLRVIATSREPLRVAAETVWQVPPLSLPPVSAPADSDALRLFADRAAAAKPGFSIGPANFAVVTQICRSLDGLPLAIELAAAWLPALAVDQISARLADRFQLLNSADRTAPARHRTLRDAIDWSYDLLSGQERVLLRRLSVFADWPLEMVEEVCAGSAGGENLTSTEILDLLTGLADKSLVIAEPGRRGKIRYRMLDTIREYALAKLAESGESDVMHLRFRAYAVAETEQMAMIGMARLPGPWSARVDALTRFDDDIANLRQVLGRALADRDADSGLRLCATMRLGWIVHGWFAEGARWADAFLGLDRAGLRDEVIGAALVARAQLALATDPDAAKEYATAGLALCRSDDAKFWAASALNLLAEVALHSGQLDQAEARADKALAVARPAADLWNEGYAAGTLAAAAALRGRLDRARWLAERALAITNEIDQQWGSARALLGLGDLARLTNQPAQARQHYTDALKILREINGAPEIARCLAGLGRIAIGQGDLASAKRYFGDSLELSQSTGSRIGVIRGLDAFAALATEQGDLSSAVRLAAAAAALRDQAGLPPAPATRAGRVMEAAAGLGEDVISDLWTAGSLLGSDEAIRAALAIAGSRRHGEDDSAALASASGGDQPALGNAPHDGQPSPDVRLTKRELQIAALIAAGSGNKAIAKELTIARATAARHVANIMGKLGVNSRGDIARWAGDRASEDRTGRLLTRLRVSA